MAEDKSWIFRSLQYGQEAAVDHPDQADNPPIYAIQDLKSRLPINYLVTLMIGRTSNYRYQMTIKAPEEQDTKSENICNYLFNLESEKPFKAQLILQLGQIPFLSGQTPPLKSDFINLKLDLTDDGIIGLNVNLFGRKYSYGSDRKALATDILDLGLYLSKNERHYIDLASFKQKLLDTKNPARAFRGLVKEAGIDLGFRPPPCPLSTSRRRKRPNQSPAPKP